MASASCAVGPSTSRAKGSCSLSSSRAGRSRAPSSMAHLSPCPIRWWTAPEGLVPASQHSHRLPSTQRGGHGGGQCPPPQPAGTSLLLRSGSETKLEKPTPLHNPFRVPAGKFLCSIVPAHKLTALSGFGAGAAFPQASQALGGGRQYGIQVALQAPAATHSAQGDPNSGSDGKTRLSYALEHPGFAVSPYQVHPCHKQHS